MTCPFAPEVAFFTRLVVLVTTLVTASLPEPTIFPAASEATAAPFWTVSAAFETKLGEALPDGFFAARFPTGSAHLLQATLQLLVMNPGFLSHSPASAHVLHLFCKGQQLQLQKLGLLCCHQCVALSSTIVRSLTDTC